MQRVLSSEIHGLGLRAGRWFEDSEIIFTVLATLDPQPIHFTNHSCHPNARYDEGSGWVQALRPIAPLEEVTINYFDWPVPSQPWAFDCQCGSKDCVGRVSNTVQT